jgi:hypothetical protein
MPPSPEQEKARQMEKKLLRSLFKEKIPLEEKIERHAEFRKKYLSQWPYSSEGALKTKWEALGLRPVGSWKKEYTKRNIQRRKGFESIRKKILTTVRVCERCKSDTRLVVHHRIPLRYGGNNDEKNLVVLCEKCHRQYHSNSCVCNIERFLDCTKKTCNNDPITRSALIRELINKKNDGNGCALEN